MEFLYQTILPWPLRPHVPTITKASNTGRTPALILAGIVALGVLFKALVVAALLARHAALGVLITLSAASLDGGAVAFASLDEGEVAADDCSFSFSLVSHH